MSIIRGGFFPFTVEGERPQRGEVIGEEYLIIFFYLENHQTLFLVIFSALSTKQYERTINTSPNQYFLRLGIIINDFKEREETFLTIKNRTFQSLNYHIFPMGLTQALAFFNKKHALTCFQRSDFWDFEILNFLTQKQDSFLSRTLINIISNPVLNAKKLRKNWNLTKSK